MSKVFNVDENKVPVTTLNGEEIDTLCEFTNMANKAMGLNAAETCISLFKKLQQMKKELPDE